MVPIAEHFRVSFTPLANPAAIVAGSQVRFTVLTSRLLRLEYSPRGQFEDRPSQVFWYRAQPVPTFTSKNSDGQIEIETDHLHLHYQVTPDGFMPDTLSITLKDSDTEWHYGDSPEGNLRGTARTLDNYDEFAPLEPGLMSRSGWVLVPDSHTLVFNGDCWLEPRETPGALDFYFFGYGHDYKACLRDYCRVTGQVPLIPRWALGNWWSRYWHYTQDELLDLMDEFQAREVPLSVCIVDMDWHITNTGNASSGWTGYTWNRALFPDPDGFVAALHAKGLKTALNLHPALGVYPHEEMYPEMAARMGIDPVNGEPVRFDAADPQFVSAYFEVLHHPHERRGIDFWWGDWQQGTETAITNLDPLWWLNHLHFCDLGRDGVRRPFIFSRWGGLGNHRYPIGFSGDSYITWNMLAFQPYFTATAANVQYGWWSHDIGGHFGGAEEPELYARWVQFGVFSPIFRLHCTKGEFYERRPWAHHSEDVFRVARDAMQLRHALIPYLYSMAWRNTAESVPLVCPMYYDYPDAEEAYACPQQYSFGSELIAAPYTSPADPTTALARQVIWLPEGDWFHFFTGEYHEGGRWIARYGRLTDIPVFAKAGAIVPLGPTVPWGGVGNPAELDVHCFAGANGRFTLYEDDGETVHYTRGSYVLTEFTQAWHRRRLEITITPPSGSAAYLPAQRTYRLHVHGIKEPKKITLEIDGTARPCTAEYDAARETLVLEPVALPVTATLRLEVGIAAGSLLSKRDRLGETLVEMLWAFKMLTAYKNRLGARLDEIRANPAVLADFEFALSDAQKRALFELITGAGMHHERNRLAPDLVVVWNNRADSRVSYHLNPTDFRDHVHFGTMAVAETGAAPRFRAYSPQLRLTRVGVVGEMINQERWQITLNYYDLLKVQVRHA